MSDIPISAKSHYWEKSKAIGDKAEVAFKVKHPELISLDGRRGEYVFGEKLERVELKADQYLMDLFKNKGRGRTVTCCAIEIGTEYYSGLKRKSGVWQAVQHNCDYFVYWFQKDDVEFWFKPKSLWNYAAPLYNAKARRIERIDNPESRKYSHCIFIPYNELRVIAVRSPLEVSNG